MISEAQLIEYARQYKAWIGEHFTPDRALDGVLFLNGFLDYVNAEEASVDEQIRFNREHDILKDHYRRQEDA